jgi:hypothetical protein
MNELEKFRLDLIIVRSGVKTAHFFFTLVFHDDAIY